MKCLALLRKIITIRSDFGNSAVFRDISHTASALIVHFVTRTDKVYSSGKCKLASRYLPPPTLISTQVEYGCVPVSKTGGDVSNM